MADKKPPVEKEHKEPKPKGVRLPRKITFEPGSIKDTPGKPMPEVC